jgi:hypothetical protein
MGEDRDEQRGARLRGRPAVHALRLPRRVVGTSRSFAMQPAHGTGIAGILFTVLGSIFPH